MFAKTFVGEILTSTPDVEELLVNDVKRSALAIVLGTDDLTFFEYNDVWRVLWGNVNCIKDLGPHYGDCIGFAMSCRRCLAEDIYQNIIKMEKETSVNLLTLILATEVECDYASGWNKYHELHGTSTGYRSPDSSVKARLKLWDNLSDDQRIAAEIRANQFRSWMKELPPFPEDYPWPDHIC